MKNKKPLLFLLLLLYSALLISQDRATIYSQQSGSWSSTSTWLGDVIPTSTDEVEIMSGHTVTVSSEQQASTITINATDGSNYGVLNITIGASLSTANNTSIYGQLSMTDGTLNVGNSGGDKLVIHGGVLGSTALLNISGGSINVSRYFDMVSGSSFTMSGGIMNINSSGGTSSTDIMDVPSGTSFTMSAGTINILNGNLGSGVALKYNPTTSAVSGGLIHIQNVKNYGSLSITCSKNLYNLTSDVGNGNILYINNMSVDSDGFELNDFTISSGAVQILASEMLTINGTANLGVGNNLCLASNNLGNASVIFNGSVSGTLSMERYLDSYSDGGDGWHHLSSPVNTMAIDGSDFDPSTNDDLYAWSETTNLWLNHKDEANSITHFTNGLGYLVAYETTATKPFTGTPNNSDITFTNLSLGSGGGWHLLGNPFTSALQWNNGDWALSNTGGVAKIWDESAGNYVDISANGIIPSTNGFFIQVSNATNSITIPASARTHNSQNNYKSVEELTQEETLHIRIHTKQNPFTDKTSLGFRSHATEDWDVDYDSRKLHGNAAAPQLWTAINGESFSTNYLPYQNASFMLPLYLIAGVDGIYTLTFDSTHLFQESTLIELEDLVTGRFIPVNDSTPYTFSASINDTDERFLLHFHKISATSDRTDIPRDIRVYANGKTISVKSKEQKPIQGKLCVYNLVGECVYEVQLQGSPSCHFHLNQAAGCYIVSLKAPTNTQTTKLIIH